MDEATPHLHIDFVPYTTGSKRGLDTRVSLKQALSALGFKGGARRETELNQWVAYEKEQLAAVMLEHGIEWEKKGTHEKHLSVLDFEKKERAKEVAELETKKAELQEENATFQEINEDLHEQLLQVDDEMLFWTKEEYMKFIEAVADKPISFYAFEILYWCGVRMGELLALTPADFDFQACTIRINNCLLYTSPSPRD